MNVKEWTKIFKGFSNENRLKILVILKKEKELPVHDISFRIGLGIKATSKHLIILANLGFLESHGKQGSVWYRLHPKMLKEIVHTMKML